MSGGANTLHGDVLSVVGDGTQTATYLADGVVNAGLDNDGSITVLGQGVINFTQLEPVDMIGLAVANVTFPNSDDNVTLTNGFDAATNTLDAIVVSGTSNLVPFEAIHLRNNTTVNNRCRCRSQQNKSFICSINTRLSSMKKFC